MAKSGDCGLLLAEFLHLSYARRVLGNPEPQAHFFMAIVPGGTRTSPLVLIVAVTLLILCLLALAWYFQRSSSMTANPPMHTSMR